MAKNHRVIITLGIFLSFLPVIASADFNNWIGSDQLSDVILNLFKWITRIALPLLAFALVWSGFKIVSARGNEQQLTEAKRNLYWIVVGTAIVVGSYTIAGIVIDFASSL